jgi:hypothetical protein
VPLDRFPRLINSEIAQLGIASSQIEVMQRRLSESERVSNRRIIMLIFLLLILVLFMLALQSPREREDEHE